MSKELYFTDGNNEVKYLDTTASFNLAITQDGSAFDLTNATAIDVKVANDTGYVFDKSIDMTTIKQPLAGLITMPVDAEVMNALVPDDYTIEVWVTLSSLITPGSQEGLTDTSTDSSTTSTTASTTTSTTTDTTMYNAIFPSDDPQGFTITDNVMSDSGDVIPVMSLDEFQQEFDQLKTDLTNQVSTLQGPKGDTGQGLEIKGKVDTTAQLPATASEGDGYLVAEELYVWTNNSWKDCGSLQGPQGIQGPVGSGLVVKGTVNDASQLPNTGNQEGYCYFVGTDLYVWDSGTWKNCGSVSTDLSNYVTVTDLNNGLSTKVTDNKNGTEQLNGVQVQPYNKLVDTIGGRNLVKGSEQEFTGKAYDFHDYNLASITELTPGKTYTVSFSAKVDDKAVNCNQHLFVAIYNPSWSFGTTVNVPISTDYQRATNTFTVPEGQTGVANITVYLSHPVINGNSDSNADNSDAAGTGYIKEFKLEQGSIATDCTPAPEDKVNVSDMRKPANDVAGIDEVETVTAPLVCGALHDGADLDNEKTAGTFFSINKVTNGPGFPNGDVFITWAVSAVSSKEATALTQMAFIQSGDMAIRNFVSGAGWGNWKIIADDSKVVHLSTGATANRPTGQVTGYQYFDTTLNKPIWYTGNNWVDATGTTV